MLAWERQEGESDKAYAAFVTYRDMGPERSHRAVAEALYGAQAKYSVRTVHEWSRKFDWVDRVRALEARDEMVRREAVEAHMRTKAHDFASRQAVLLERMLGQAEKAADNVDSMLAWPLSEERVLREGENGEDVTVILMPARWNKGTVKTYYDIAGSAATGRWTAGFEEVEDDLEFDFSALTLDEQRAYLEIIEKIGSRRRGLEGHRGARSLMHHGPTAAARAATGHYFRDSQPLYRCPLALRRCALVCRLFVGEREVERGDLCEGVAGRMLKTGRRLHGRRDGLHHRALERLFRDLRAQTERRGRDGGNRGAVGHL